MSKFQILKEYDYNLLLLKNILSDGSTTNIQLNYIGNFLFGKLFLGVFSSNQFPKRIKNNEMFISNTSPSYSKGIHWVGFYQYNNNLYAYDTFNRPVNSLSKYFKNKHIINANKSIDESINESNCGQRVMAWLISFHSYKDKIINII
jgi:hypothetical protein